MKIYTFKFFLFDKIQKIILDGAGLSNYSEASINFDISIAIKIIK
jgi:hypothetical protein